MLRISLKKLRIHLENRFILISILLFKVSLLKKKLFLFFFPLFNLTQISTVNLSAHVDRKFITSLLNKFYKWLLALNFRRPKFIFPVSNFTQIRTANFWTHLDGKFITSLLNKFYKWPLIFVGLKLSSA